MGTKHHRWHDAHEQFYDHRSWLRNEYWSLHGLALPRKYLKSSNFLHSDTNRVFHDLRHQVPHGFIELRHEFVTSCIDRVQKKTMTYSDGGSAC